YYYIKSIPIHKGKSTFWEGKAFIIRKDNKFASLIKGICLRRNFEQAEEAIYFQLKEAQPILQKKPKDWNIPDIYRIIAEYFYIYDHSKRLDIDNYVYHNNIGIIKQKIQKLSELQKCFMIYPSDEFCHDILESEYLFRVKSDLYLFIQEIEIPSYQVRLAGKKLEQKFIL
ncbi:hypothetical protein, partial [Candidatus Albibeggiatoa sp. nov. BB20]|uniref:hypothetical protein n=1 Tax=Candidatus Albibeggiatoa sp. nov. BB20 TaxID=3162723 RepID=UPI0033653501